VNDLFLFSLTFLSTNKFLKASYQLLIGGKFDFLHHLVGDQGGARDVTQWWSTFLACTSPWLDPQPCQKKCSM
jgi:hypothetical protein